MFSNTSPAIEKAVEEGYVQSVENDFTYDKNIGVKVDNIVLDELNLNISFLYKDKSENENIKSIRLNKFIIQTDTGEKIFDSDQQYTTSLDEVYTASSMNWLNQPEKIEDYTFKDSILFTLGERSKDKKELIFQIESIDIVYEDNKREEVYGKWNFNIEIKDEMRKSQNIEYKLMGENEYIESCIGTLSPTGLEVTFNLKNPLNPMDYSLKNSGNISGPGFFFIKDASGYKFPNDINADNECKKYVMKYDNISSFSEITQKIEIFLEPYNTTITLEKINNLNTSIKYELKESSKYLESCTGVLAPTGFKLEMVLREPLDIGKFFEENEDKVHGHMLFYYIDNGIFFEPVRISGNGITYTMPFDNISSLDEIPEEIEIYADPFECSFFLKKAN